LAKKIREKNNIHIKTISDITLNVLDDDRDDLSSHINKLHDFTDFMMNDKISS